MPRSLEEILHCNDELATRYEDHDAEFADVADAAAIRAVRAAFAERAEAEARLTDAVSVARAEGHSWAAIGAMVGTSGEGRQAALRQPSPRR